MSEMEEEATEVYVCDLSAGDATEPCGSLASARGNYCYLLISETRKRTYIGASKDPWHRLRQHNGEIRGGARATQTGRPWSLHATVEGLPDWRAALRLEWKWKHDAIHKKRPTRGLQPRMQRIRELLLQMPDLILKLHHQGTSTGLDADPRVL